MPCSINKKITNSVAFGLRMCCERVLDTRTMIKMQILISVISDFEQVLSGYAIFLLKNL